MLETDGPGGAELLVHQLCVELRGSPDLLGMNGTLRAPARKRSVIWLFV
jgi:hypothetical protein